MQSVLVRKSMKLTENGISSRQWSTEEVRSYPTSTPLGTFHKSPSENLNEFGVKFLPHPPYSSYISPTDYHLINHFQNFLTGRTFARTAFVEYQISSFYVDDLNRLVLCWQQCTDSGFYDIKCSTENVVPT